MKLIALGLLSTRGQRLRRGAEHRLLDGPQRARVLAVERAQDVDSRAGHGALTRDGIALVRLIGKYLRIGDNRSLTWSV